MAIRYIDPMKARCIKALPFALVALLELWLAHRSLGVLAALWTWAGCATAWVSMSYLSGEPALLGKSRGGLLILAPFTLFAAAIARIAQALGVTERSEVAPSLWVGGWPRTSSATGAQLDCTSELPRRGRSDLYLCTPMLDGIVPEQATLRRAIIQARDWRREGRTVLVHCAYGHGRSVAVACAVMVLDGDASDTMDALRRIRAHRRGARMEPAQKRAVDDAVYAISTVRTRDCPLHPPGDAE